MSEEVYKPTEEEVQEYLNQPGVREGISAGVKAMKEGRVTSWEDVKRELGMEEDKPLPASELVGSPIRPIRLRIDHPALHVEYDPDRDMLKVFGGEGEEDYVLFQGSVLRMWLTKSGGRYGST